MTPWVAIGTLTQPKGVNGRLGVALAPGFFALKDGLTVFIVPPDLDVPRTHTITAHGQSSAGQLWIELSGIKDRDTARRLQGRRCLIRREDAEGLSEPFDGGVAEDDWVGWTIIDEDGQELGIVTSVAPRPLQPLLTVADACGHEWLLPLAEELIVALDEPTRRLSVTLPPGLTEL